MTMNTDTFISTSLQALGLSDKEAVIYETCLNRGEINVVELSRQAKISRSTTYFIADELVKKGLLRFVQKGAHRIYSAEDPRQLEQLLEQERAKTYQKEATLRSLLPSLNMRYSGAHNKPVVSYYTGQEEMRRIFEDALLSQVEELLFVGEIHVLIDAVGREYLASWNRRKVAAGIKTRGIWQQSTAPEETYLQANKSNLREARYGPPTFESPTYVLLYSNKVAFLSSAIEAYGVLIESKDLSVSMRSWFDVLWQSAEK